MVKYVLDQIDKKRKQIIEMSHDIHSTPEIGFEEYESSKTLCDALERIGFEVTRGVGELETAFVAKVGNGKGPVVAILAEYDALPNIGHGCGHNIISAVAYGVAEGYADNMGTVDGEIRIIGTPAEENGGGKIKLIDHGTFNDVDFAMMVHPSSTNLVKRGGTALVEFNVSYAGKRAHSSSPENGVNALKALIQTFNGIDALQGEFPLGINVNGIIKAGGEASNIIPDKASAEFVVRGTRLLDLKVVKEKIIQVVKAAEIMTGAKATYSFELPYAERYTNHIMGEAFKMIMEKMGETVEYPKKNVKLGSSDIGNVSLNLPVIHPYIKIGNDLKAHTLAFTEASVGSRADDMIIKGSKALAELAYKLLTSEEFRDVVRYEFEDTVPDYRGFEF